MGQVPSAEGPGRELTALVASAPGKLILMGEHAVVYGEPALATAVDLRLRARFESPADAEAEVEILLPTLGHRTRLAWVELAAYADAARDRWEGFAAAPGQASFSRLRGEDPAHLVKVALGEAARGSGDGGGPPLRVEIGSRVPVGRGFGSSAALAVAVAGGYLAWRGRPPRAERLEALALDVERRQHGTPSGVDAAASLRGGVVWAERGAGGALEFRALAAPEEHLRRFRVFDTGEPTAATGAVVAAVRERIEAEPARFRDELAAMGRATRRFRDALSSGGSPGDVVELVRRFERGLEELGVVPAPVCRIVRAVEERGGAAKISGAGAPAGTLRVTGRPEGAPSGPSGAGSLLVYHPEPERVESWEFLEGLPRRRLTLGAEGFRLESREEGPERREET